MIFSNCIDEILALIQREDRYQDKHAPLLSNRPVPPPPSKKTKLRQGLSSPSGIRSFHTTTHSDEVDTSIASSSVTVMREKICQWMYKVVDHCNLDRQIIYTA